MNPGIVTMCEKCNMPRYSGDAYSRWNPEWRQNRCGVQAIEPVSVVPPYGKHGERMTSAQSHISWGDHEPGLKVRLVVETALESSPTPEVSGFVCKRCRQVVVVPNA